MASDELPDGKGKVGRPSKYDPDYPGLLIEHMREGGSFWTFGAVVGVGMQTLQRWLEEHEEFREAKHEGSLLEMHWWENISTKTASGRMDGNPTLIIWNQKNKWPKIYKERPAKQKVDQTIQLNHVAAIQSLVATLEPAQLLMMANAITDRLSVMTRPASLPEKRDDQHGGNNGDEKPIVSGG